MRRTLHILCSLLMAALAAVSCSESEQIAPNRGCTATPITVELYMNNATDDTRTPGDPGVDSRLELPHHLYVFSYLLTSADTYTLYCVQRNLHDGYWTSEGEGKEQRWVLNINNENVASKLVGAYDTEYVTRHTLPNPVGHLYAIATEKEFSEAQLQQIHPNIALKEHTEADNITVQTIDLKKADVTAIGNALMDLSDFYSDDLRDLYSNPTRDTRVDENNILNGDIHVKEIAGSDGTKAQTIVHGAVRLYHTAAKVDFTWEVPADKQSTTSISKIEVTNLPTQCRIFDPTHNPTTNNNGSSSIAKYDATNHPNPPYITPGNQWIGRECVYVLQPQSGTINYSVTKEVSETATTVTPTPFTPGTLDQTFTGWYRIIATVN